MDILEVEVAIQEIATKCDLSDANFKNLAWCVRKLLLETLTPRQIHINRLRRELATTVLKLCHRHAHSSIKEITQLINNHTKEHKNLKRPATTIVERRKPQPLTFRHKRAQRFTSEEPATPTVITPPSTHKAAFETRKVNTECGVYVGIPANFKHPLAEHLLPKHKAG